MESCVLIVSGERGGLAKDPSLIHSLADDVTMVYKEIYFRERHWSSHCDVFYSRLHCTLSTSLLSDRPALELGRDAGIAPGGHHAVVVAAVEGAAALDMVKDIRVFHAAAFFRSGNGSDEAENECLVLHGCCSTSELLE